MAGNNTSHQDQEITSVSFNTIKTTVKTSAIPTTSPPIDFKFFSTKENYH